MRETVLVSGGAGYIGSHTCKALARAGYLPVSYDSLATGNRWAVQWGPFEHGDIADASRLAAVVARYNPVAAIHFAASAYVGESVSDPGKYYRNNVGGTLSLLECLRTAGVRRVVFSSTCATYGIPKTLPISEDTPQAPINPYGRSKLMIEQMLADYGMAYELRSVALRYFNAAGADADGEIGEHHDPETHIIPLVLRAALEPSCPVTVFGTDYPTADGTCVRDYVHVADLALAHVRALEFTGKPAAPATSVFNLGTGNGFSVRQIIDTARRVTGLEPAVKIGPRRAGDPAALVASAERAYSTLGWRSQSSDIDTIMASAWAWMRR